MTINYQRETASGPNFAATRNIRPHSAGRAISGCGDGVSGGAVRSRTCVGGPDGQNVVLSDPGPEGREITLPNDPRVRRVSRCPGRP